MMITSAPDQAEVLLDGAATLRQTPVKLDGIAAGDHVVTLRYYGYKVWRRTITVSGGLTKRVAAHMAPLSPTLIRQFHLQYETQDVAYDPVSGYLFAGVELYNKVQVYQVSGPLVMGPVAQIQVGSPPSSSRSWQRLLALSAAANRVYVGLRGADSIAIIDLRGMSLVKKIGVANARNFSALALSSDGRWAAAADSANRKVWLFDAGRDSLLRSITLPGTPTDITFGPGGDRLYATLASNRQLAEIDVSAGTVLRTAVTSSNPGGMSWSGDGLRLMVCNRNTFTPQQQLLSTWATEVGLRVPMGEMMPNGCYAGDGVHAWVCTPMMPHQSGDLMVCDPGFITAIYLPNWQMAASCQVGLQPWKLLQSPDGQYIYVFEKFGRSIDVVKSETE